MEILNLPDELLLMIFRNVTSNDLLSLARTCQRFADLTADRRLVSIMNFRHDTMLRCDLLRNFLSKSVRTDEIITIDLTSCHWLSSTFLLNVLLRLRNVENILVADTALSSTHLKRVFSCQTRIKRLSWSWRTNSKTTDFGLLLQNLVFLYLCIHDANHVVEISTSSFLEACANLEELWIVCVPSLHHSPVITLPKQLNVKKLVVCHTDVSNVSPNTSMSHLWSPHAEFVERPSNLEALLAMTWDEAKHIGSANTNSLKRLSVIKPIEKASLQEFQTEMTRLTALHLMLPKEFPILFADNTQIEELSLCEITPSSSGEMEIQSCSLNYCESVALCPGLRRLVLPKAALVCLAYKSHTGGDLQGRFGHIIGPIPEGTETPFMRMIHNTPLMEEFEIGTEAYFVKDTNLKPKTFTIPTSLQLDIYSLSHIAKWEKLSSLTLADLFILDGKFFTPIIIHCKALKNLKVLNLGLKGKCCYARDLYHALKYSTSLIDFEWEQANVGNTVCLWEALCKVTTLQRLAIRNSGVSDIHEGGIIHLLDKIPSLSFLFVLTGATQKRCVTLKRNVLERWSKQRPALVVQFVSSSVTNWLQKINSIPAVHHGEMWTWKSRVVNIPTSSSSFLSFRFSSPVAWAPHV